VSAEKRLLALPGVADHEETPYALSFLNAAEQRLTAPETRLLIVANAARAAAAQADTADDDVRVVLFRDIEQICRRLVDAAVVEPVLGRRGWSRHDRAASEAIQHRAAQWGLATRADHPHTHQAVPDNPPVPAYIAREAADRAAVRARCAPGIRCNRCFLIYGAVWVDHPGRRRFLCTGCIPAEKADLLTRGFSPAVQPVPGGVPDGARFTVRLYNATGPGAKAVECDTAQRAQFIAETERPFNNTGHEIWVQYASCPTAWPTAAH
jgi:hypothetical protein